jgi:HAD superfamily hydrolase (TIGR01509 family)
VTDTASPAFLFDLDGTLLDSVYQHVIAWQRAYDDIGLDPALWRVHRRIGMSGSLVAGRVASESGRELNEAEREHVESLHGDYYKQMMDAVRPLPGARDLLLALSDADIAWAIASSSSRAEADALVAKLKLGMEPAIVSNDDVSTAKPDPAGFLAAADKLGVRPDQCIVVGDAVWDMLAARRAGMLAVGLLCGGRPASEFEQAQALRVYEDPADLHANLDELGVLLD